MTAKPKAQRRPQLTKRMREAICVCLDYALAGPEGGDLDAQVPNIEVAQKWLREYERWLESKKEARRG